MKGKTKDHLGDLGICGRKITKWILWDMIMWTGFIWFRIVTSGRLCEHSN
jgi:hypothetical protein